MAGLNLRWRSGASARASDSSADRSYALAVWLAVLAISLLAFTARAYNLHWDEGTHAHPDERHITMVSIALALPGSIGEYFNTSESPLNPYNLENVGSFVYGTFPVFLTKATAVLLGRDTYDELVIVGRWITALFATGTVLFAFLAGRRLYGVAAGLLAATLMAAAPLAIQHAHFFVVDTHLTFFMAGAFYFAVRVMQEGNPADYALGGLMLGLGMACKVTGVLVLPVLLAAAAVRLADALQQGGRLDARALRPVLGVALVLLVAFLAFRVAQPYAFDGPLSLNERWVEDQREQERLLSGEIGFPPSVQWIDRTSYLYPLQEMVLWGMGPAFGIAAWLALGYAGYRLVRYRELVHLVPVLFVLVYFGFFGRQFTLYMRYFLPLYPVMAVLAGYGLVALYRAALEAAGRLRRPWLEHAGLAACGVVVLASLAAGLAYAGIYSRDFTRAEATRWLYVNAPDGAVIAGEAWDETLPMGIQDPPERKRFEVFGLNLYDPDRQDKLAALVDDLDRADYVTVSSNRIMNSLPRNPVNYPVVSRYHEMLLSGELGYELVAEFTSYPGLFGISVPDHRVQESWSSYDHPRVLIFQKSPGYSRERLEVVLGAGPFATVSITPAQADGANLLLTPADLATQREGGTWTDVFSEGGLAGNYPTLVWLVAIQAAALAVTPLAVTLFRRLPDRGYLLAKPLGLLLLGYVTWLAVSLKLVHFEQGTVLAVLVLLGLAGAAVAYLRRGELRAFFRQNWRLVLFSELLFLGAFFLFWLLRIENPDLWHPFRGGEKPMDLAYLTAVVRSTTLPPYDPWFAGGYINYYYLGQFFTATITKLTAIPPEIAFNLAVPTYFALTVAGAFSVAYNLAGAMRGYLTPRPPLPAGRGGEGGPAEKPEPTGSEAGRPQEADVARASGEEPLHSSRGHGEAAPASDPRAFTSRSESPAEPAGAAATPLRPFGRAHGKLRRGGWGVRSWSPYGAGLLGVFLVALAGNLDGVGQMVERLSEVSSFHMGSGIPIVDSVVNSAGGLWQVVVHGAALRDFDFWRSSRMLPPTISITEFPFFSFLFADLHAHMMAIAFQVLTIAVCLALVLSTSPQKTAPEVEDEGPEAAHRSRAAPLRRKEGDSEGTPLVHPGRDAAPSALPLRADSDTRSSEDLPRRRGEHDRWRDLGLVVLLGLAVGSLRWINSWDYPPFLLLAFAAILISERYMEGGAWPALQRVALKGGLLVVLSFVFFQPFLANYRTPVAGITSSPEQTPVHQYLAHFGVFAAVIVAGLAAWSYRALKAVPAKRPAGSSRIDRGTAALLLIGGSLAVGFASLALVTLGQPLVAALVPVFVVVTMLALRELVLRRPDGGIRLFVLALIGLGLGLSMGVDIVILEGDIVRMNTVFKFYLHVWVLFALASAFLAWQLIFVFWRPLVPRRRAVRGGLPPLLTRGALAGFALLLLGAALYPVFATPVRLDDRFSGSTSRGLDGTAYAQNAIYGDAMGPLVLAEDFEGIEWLRHNVEGTPTIVEGRAELYRWGGRFSIYTGLPAVLGWDWHQTQQRGDLAFMVQQRAMEVDAFYSLPDTESALRFLQRYDVRYVIVGELERNYYSAEGIAKFETGLGGALQPVFQNQSLTIYEVLPGPPAAAISD